MSTLLVIFGVFIVYNLIGLGLVRALGPRLAPGFITPKGATFANEEVAQQDYFHQRDLKRMLLRLQWLWPVTLFGAFGTLERCRIYDACDPVRQTRKREALEAKIAESELECERLRRIADALTDPRAERHI